MTKKTRTILFLALIFLFLITAPSVVLYFQGYRIDANRKKIVQTGGISIAAWPKYLQVELDGKPKKTTGFLSGKTFLQNLLPGTHTVTIKKNGYLTWQKELEVRERRVTEVHNIILWPEDLLWEQLIEDVENYWASPGRNIILLEKGRAGPVIIEVLDIKNKSLMELQFEPKGLQIVGDIENVSWSNDKNRIILKTSSKKYPYLVGDLSSGKIVPIDWARNVMAMALSPLDKNKLLILSHPNTLWIYDLAQKDSQILLQDTLAFAVVSEGIIWLNTEGYIYLSNFSGTIIRVLNEEPHNIKPEAEYQINALNPQRLLLRENSTLFFFSSSNSPPELMEGQATKTLTKIEENVQDIIFSPDQRKAAFRTLHEIWILYLEPQLGQPTKQAGEYNLLTRFSEEIRDIAWIGSNHLVIAFENKTRVAEIDDRDGINIADIALPENGKGALRKISFSGISRQMYLLFGEKIFRSKRLLP